MLTDSLCVPDIPALVDVDLYQNSYAIEHITVHILVVSVLLAKNTPLFESSVNCFVTTTDSLHSFFVMSILEHIERDCWTAGGPVSTVC